MSQCAALQCGDTSLIRSKSSTTLRHSLSDIVTFQILEKLIVFSIAMSAPRALVLVSLLAALLCLTAPADGRHTALNECLGECWRVYRFCDGAPATGCRPKALYRDRQACSRRCTGTRDNCTKTCHRRYFP